LLFIPDLTQGIQKVICCLSPADGIFRSSQNRNAAEANRLCVGFIVGNGGAKIVIFQGGFSVSFRHTGFYGHGNELLTVKESDLR
jgi:hypothetical protein